VEILGHIQKAAPGEGQVALSWAAPQLALVQKVLKHFGGDVVRATRVHYGQFRGQLYLAVSLTRQPGDQPVGIQRHLVSSLGLEAFRLIRHPAQLDGLLQRARLQNGLTSRLQVNLDVALPGQLRNLGR
jgi:hypothetical protein